jgi:hypothetical protein
MAWRCSGDREGEIGALVEREGIGVAVRQGDAAGLAEQLLRLAGDAGLEDKFVVCYSGNMGRDCRPAFIFRVNPG